MNYLIAFTVYLTFFPFFSFFITSFNKQMADAHIYFNWCMTLFIWSISMNQNHFPKQNLSTINEHNITLVSIILPNGATEIIQYFSFFELYYVTEIDLQLQVKLLEFANIIS